MFNQSYYYNNKQDKKRLALYFYKNVVKRNFSPSRFLDFGCGTGWFLNEINKLTSISESYGFEVSEYAISKAKINAKKSKIITDLKDIKDNSLDCISSLHVFEHIRDEELNNILKNFKRILKKNGNLLLVMPAKGGLANTLKKNNWIGFSDKTHINMKNYQEWINFFKKNNLMVIQSASDGLWDFPYKIKNIFKFIKIIYLMIFQIYLGKLYISNKDGESFIFILKFN